MNAEPATFIVIAICRVDFGACLKVVPHIIREGRLVGCFDFEAASSARPAGD